METLAAAANALATPGTWLFIGIADENYDGPLDPDAWRTAVLPGAKGKKVTVQVRAYLCWPRRARGGERLLHKTTAGLGVCSTGQLARVPCPSHKGSHTCSNMHAAVQLQERRAHGAGGGGDLAG